MRDTTGIYATPVVRFSDDMAHLVRTAAVVVAIVMTAACGNEEPEPRPLGDRSKVFEHAISGHVPLSELPGTYASGGGHRLHLGEAGNFEVRRAGRTIDAGSYRAVREDRRFDLESETCGAVALTWSFHSGALTLSGDEGYAPCRAARILDRVERWEPVD